MMIAQACRFALSLPETTEEPHFHASSYRVRGKIFATAPPEDDVLHIFIDEEEREAAHALEPDFLKKLFWGKRACGLRVFLANASSKVLDNLLMQAWKRKAPKLLLATPAAAAGRKPPPTASAKNKTMKSA